MMTTCNATYHELADKIQHLIRHEQYAPAQDLLPTFAQAVIEACNESGQEQAFLEARQFLKSAVVAVKSRQAHFVSELSDLRRQRAYTGTPDPERQHALDCKL